MFSGGREYRCIGNECVNTKLKTEMKYNMNFLTFMDCEKITKYEILKITMMPYYNPQAATGSVL